MKIVIKRDVDHVSAKAVQRIALSEHRHPIVLLADASPKAVLSPCIANPLGDSLWFRSLEGFCVEHLGGDEFRRSSQLGLADVLPCGREAINRGEYDVQTGDCQQQGETTRTIDIEQTQANRKPASEPA